MTGMGVVVWVFGLGHKKTTCLVSGSASECARGWVGGLGRVRADWGFRGRPRVGCGLTPFSAEQLVSECFSGSLKSGNEHLFPMVHENPPFLSCGLRVPEAKPSSSRDYTKKARRFWWGVGLLGAHWVFGCDNLKGEREGIG